MEFITTIRIRYIFPSPARAQLLRFVVSGNQINLMHKDLKIANIFVTQAHNLELARLAVGDFGAAQEGDLSVSFRKSKKPRVSLAMAPLVTNTTCFKLDILTFRLNRKLGGG